MGLLAVTGAPNDMGVEDKGGADEPPRMSKTFWDDLGGAALRALMGELGSVGAADGTAEAGALWKSSKSSSRETPVSGVGRGFPTTGAAGAAKSSSPNPPRRSTAGVGGAGALGAGAGAEVREERVAAAVREDDTDAEGREEDDGDSS